ncbi:MAG: indolepyruvate ferredoxin oxidoreductase subunit beta [Thermoproteota archaeon]|jgi:indolepyruvate ferredoxin oxidoreductase beta subunit|uniref:Indolepyruvate ferredoxin oxidoreductase subunit beta n=1 Tax=Candidatus Methanodesulfokora washburnensis TaxID=2478471 RepID=A0A520KN31_9CREN|nr:MAG: indolepyruvate ferredoxin oxidoreductase subunit beta [Candidatus Methanodesulfokores washburnensis]TDA38213.1 MAG: indolepyruvate ferredoxin oxidoreductase subunit beta [Candidatus Korarchaeota archaeon]
MLSDMSKWSNRGDIMVDLVVCGVGGQGIVLISRVLARAALLSGLHVTVSEVRGLAQREGSVSSHIRIGDHGSLTIAEGKADAVVSMELVEAARNLRYLREGGVVVSNDYVRYHIPHYLGISKFPEREDLIKMIGKHRAYLVNARKIAESLGNIRVVNSVMLGAVYSTGVLPFSLKEITDAISESVPEKYRDVNISAFKLGMEAVRP